MATRPHQLTTATYERRLILFIDFLSFREVVASTERDANALTRLIAALDDIGRLGEAGIFESQRVTQFSDSVVMSYRVDEQSGVFWMMHAIALTIISLASRGFLLRGAVTVGDLYHTQRHLVGPAMVQAYEMESRIAQYPRVIVDPAVMKLARRHRSEIHSPHEEEGYVRRFITEDTDGLLFIDYISWTAVVDVAGADDDLYPAYLAKLGELLEAGLAHAEPRVVEKYLWLHPRYLAALELFRSLPGNDPYRLEYPEKCAAVERLPSLASLAQRGRLRVERHQSARGTAL